MAARFALAASAPGSGRFGRRTERPGVSYRSRFLVEPGKRVRLGDADPSYTGQHEDEDAVRAAMAKDLERLSHLQYALYAENARSLLIVLQAPDAGGKDGTVKHVFGAFNPMGASVHAFKEPTRIEAAHDFLWRVHQVTPARGRIVIFNRSHYEDVLVPRVHRTVARETIAKRLDRILDFEKNLVQSGTHVLKFYLHISKDEQLERFKARLDDPRRQWKISESDYAERKHWDDYRKAYEDALERTSTHRAPWFVIPANHKWFRNLAVARIVADAMDALDLRVPKPSVDIQAMLRAYHAAEAKANAGG
jgi:PPK2 family polyphosphate:nucleotide phosphotransferase